jgi:eukaryotic-like serine/threonine-protein kinase
MSTLGDGVLAHLCAVADWPDVTGTRYDVVEKIGQGGMGSVFLARDRELDRPVALKVINVAPTDQNSQVRMMSEARIVARLEHPGIVPIHDCGILPDGRFFYAMKLVRGKRLDDQSALPAGLVERLRLFLKICEAVAFAHESGILHRDLKPQNIMLGAFGEVLVLDWGLAKESHKTATREDLSTSAPTVSSRPDTRHGAILGTPGYMAPEQASGEHERIDERTDVYALGAVLFFLLTGKAPEAERKTGWRHDLAAGAAVRRRGSSIPRPLQAICLKALACEPANRYAGANELKDDISNFLASERVSAYPESLLGAAFRLGTKYRTPIGLIAAYLVMRVLLLLWV